MNKPTIFLLATALAGASGSVAFADDAAPAGDGSGATSDVPAGTVSSELTLPKGAFMIDLDIGMDLSKGLAFKPVSISPDIWYGITDDFTLGLVHSATGATGVIGGFGQSLCVTGTNDLCDHVYNNVGLDGRIRLARPFAVDVGLYIENLGLSETVDGQSVSTPFQLAAKLGISGRWQWGNLSLEAQPNIFIGLTNRNPSAFDTNTNTETLYVPVTVAYLVLPKLDIALQPALDLPFTNTGNDWSIPISIAVRAAVSPSFSVGLAFTFLDLIGGGNDTGADLRSLTLGANYAF